MKRSEVLFKIKVLLEKFDMGGSLSRLSYAEGAEHLLDELETLGMLPPEISDPENSYRMYDTGMKSEWEAEIDHPEDKDEYGSEGYIAMHKLEVETRHIDCECDWCKEKK